MSGSLRSAHDLGCKRWSDYDVLGPADDHEGYQQSEQRNRTEACESIRRASADYWWGIEQGHKKMHWKSWEWLSTPKGMGGMGFRDLVLFNQAMLGRQCWRLLTDPASLCARVLKGRYYPDCDFLNAPTPRSASYTWRSIRFGMELVRHGSRWSVGNGELINIHLDSWIPGVRPNSFQSNLPIPETAKVSALLNADCTAWDAEVIRGLFSDQIAELILCIPISSRIGEDFISWAHTKFGNYSVRSAYLARASKLITDRSKCGRGSSSSSAEEAHLWKLLWSIKAPGKMKINLWRFAHDCLPSGLELRRRHIPADIACVHCGRDESIEHALLSVSLPLRCGGRSRWTMIYLCIDVFSLLANSGFLISCLVPLRCNARFSPLFSGTFGIIAILFAMARWLGLPARWLFNLKHILI